MNTIPIIIMEITSGGARLNSPRDTLTIIPMRRRKIEILGSGIPRNINARDSIIVAYKAIESLLPRLKNSLPVVKDNS